MITKSSNLVIVEGNLVPADGAGELARGRVVIDVATGLIVETGEARGSPRIPLPRREGRNAGNFRTVRNSIASFLSCPHGLITL